MRASSWIRVEPLMHLRAHLIELRDNGKIEVSIGGQYQNRDFVGHVEQAIRLELRNRIVEIENQLRGHGVEID